MNLVSHIEFLLHQHNCVVVPDLGGFIVNVVPSRRQGVSDFCAPTCELVFNRDLTHNDGLLAQLYMKTDMLSFEAASRKIDQEVQALKQQLREKRSLDLGKLGNFTIYDNERFVYTPAKYARPAFFGLETALLQPIIQMPTPMLPPKRETKNLRKFSLRAAAAAIAGLLLFAIPSNDANIRQSAQMFPTIEKTTAVSHQAVSEEVPETFINIPQAIENAPVNPPTMETGIENLPTYYIIVGVFQYAAGANTTKNQLIERGISQATTVEHNGRFFVATASHNDRAEAQAGLRRLRQEHPMYFDAWVLER